MYLSWARGGYLSCNGMEERPAASRRDFLRKLQGHTGRHNDSHSVECARRVGLAAKRSDHYIIPFLTDDGTGSDAATLHHSLA